MDNKLNISDLVNIGIFSAIYLSILFIFSILGFIPILYLLAPSIAPMIIGVPFMLFLTKVKKFGMVTIMGTILGISMFIMGNTWIPLVFGSIFGLLGDSIFRSGKYKSYKTSVLGYGVFSIWLIGILLPFWLLRDSYSKYVISSMGYEYVNSFLSLITWWTPIILVISTFISGLIGAYFGKIILEKHFKKAGLT